MRNDNLLMIQDTLNIFEEGFYQVNGEIKKLKLSRKQTKEAMVFLPEDIEKMNVRGISEDAGFSGQCVYGCENTDSFAQARRISELFGEQAAENTKPVLVLNLANPVNPGGGVRRGAQAQEEDLCRKSSLLLSLESENAAAYYAYNRSLNTNMGSDAVIIHPQVEIIRDENGDLLPDSVIVSVMTCAAPMLLFGLMGRTEEQYEEMMYHRIAGMLKTAAAFGYRYLVLGAFGCGAFRNDARVVSDLFYKVLQEHDFGGRKASGIFRRIDFAVLDRSDKQYNFREFSRNFGSLRSKDGQPETVRRRKNVIRAAARQDVIRGCIFGGAVGDALGYPVEFLQEDAICRNYGTLGIRAYDKDRMTGKAIISDDTQMSLFTANGLLAGDTDNALRGIQNPPRSYVKQAYLDWLLTQESSMEEVNRHERGTAEGGYSWLLDVPELYSRRAPGNTCLSALFRERGGESFDDYVAAKRNDSKGCGGIMRVAPLGVYREWQNIEQLDLEGAELAAITHGHSLGYMPAAVLVHIINRIVYPPDHKIMELLEIVLEARDTAAKIFSGDPHLPELLSVINRAVILSEDDYADDREQIHRLGEGWVAEETLGISLYCALKYEDDFSAGITAAVNHRGDSDSTGAVTGNILGAIHGYQAIPWRFKEDLEISDIIMEIADDLFYGSMMNKDNVSSDPLWETRYIRMHNKP